MPACPEAGASPPQLEARGHPTALPRAHTPSRGLLLRSCHNLKNQLLAKQQGPITKHPPCPPPEAARTTLELGGWVAAWVVEVEATPEYLRLGLP